MRRRDLEQIIADADELAVRFEDADPDDGRTVDAAELAQVRRSFEHVAAAQIDLVEAVEKARHVGFSWALIGAMMGITGEAARQRFSESHADDE